VIVVGVDPHKKTHTAVAAAENGRPLGDITVGARHKGHERVLEWARGLDVDRIFAIEDCRQVSGSLERFLIERGERVIRIPPKMMAGVRRSAREAGKREAIRCLKRELVRAVFNTLRSDQMTPTATPPVLEPAAA
jgi:transposase